MCLINSSKLPRTCCALPMPMDTFCVWIRSGNRHSVTARKNSWRNSFLTSCTLTIWWGLGRRYPLWRRRGKSYNSKTATDVRTAPIAGLNGLQPRWEILSLRLHGTLQRKSILRWPCKSACALSSCCRTSRPGSWTYLLTGWILRLSTDWNRSSNSSRSIVPRLFGQCRIGHPTVSPTSLMARTFRLFPRRTKFPYRATPGPTKNWY